MVISFFAASTALTVPSVVRNEPVTTSSAVNFAPSVLFSPLARSWSPAFTSSKVEGLASANLMESGA